MCNTDIRGEIKRAGLFHWQVAKAIGVSEVTFCRQLREELTQARKEDVRAAIKRLSGVKAS